MALLSRQEPIPTNFSRLAYHASIILNRTVYIDGGDLTVRAPDGKFSRETNNSTLVLDVSRSWSDGNYGAFSSITKGDSAILNLGHLWAATENLSFYQFGGVPSSAPFVSRPVPLRSFDRFTLGGSPSAGGKWSSVPLSGDSIFASLDRPAAGSSAFGDGKGFLLGGFAHRDGDITQGMRPLPGLLTYDMARNAWTNSTAQAFSPSGAALLGTMQFLPDFGTQGVLIAFGGQTADPSKEWSNGGENMLDMSDIHIYDIAKEQWYHQTAVGATPEAIPAERNLFCSAVLKSNRSSGAAQAEVFVYGGETGNFVFGDRWPTAEQFATNAALNAVHVLTIPGFAWFRANDTTAPSRTCHTCEVVGQRQVLSIGGLDPTYNDHEAANVADPFRHGLGVFDMSTWRWKQSYDADAAPYEPADTIKEWYQQNRTVRWNDNNTAALFSNTSIPATTYTPPPTGSSVLPGASSNASATGVTSLSPPSGSSISTGGTIGAAVGGVLGLLTLASLAALYLRWRRKPPRSGILKRQNAELHGNALREMDSSNRRQQQGRLFEVSGSPIGPEELPPDGLHEIPGNGTLASPEQRTERVWSLERRSLSCRYVRHSIVTPKPPQPANQQHSEAGSQSSRPASRTRGTS